MQKTVEHQSSVFPGATFELRIVSRVLRHQTEIKLAPERHKGRLLLEQWRAIVIDDMGLEKPTKQLSPEQVAEWTKVNEKPPSITLLSDEEKSEVTRLTIDMELANQASRMEIMRARLVKCFVPGEQYADVKTADDLLTSDLEAFAIEVEDAANKDWQLPETKLKNFASPISSQQQGDGPTNDSTAGDAGRTTSTQSEVAA